jgi:hypothetical protein
VLRLLPLLLLLPAPAAAWTQLRTTDGTPLRWPDDNPWGIDGPYLPLVGNALNRGNVAPSDLRRAVVNGLHQWQRASDWGFSWDYWQGIDLEVYPPAVRRDGVSTIHFAVASGNTSLPRDAAAFTQVWWDPETLAIAEIDIVLNDQTFEFTNDPDEAVYAQGTSNRVLYLDDVVAHEIGHALGLDHSGSLGATMFTWGWVGQSTLACDDRAGAVAAFPPADPERGEISGYVLDPEGQPVFGAQVSLLRAERGGVEATVVTDEGGRWVARWLEPGEYWVLVEPWFGEARSLSPHYEAMDHRRCFGEFWSRQFVTWEDGHTLRGVEVQPGGSTGLPPVQVRCTPGVSIELELGTAGWEDAPTVFEPGRAAHTGPQGEARFALVDRPPAGGCAGDDCSYRFYRLADIEGDLRVRALSYSLYSPVAYRVLLWTEQQLLDGARDPFWTTGPQPIVRDEQTGFRVWDRVLEVQDLPPGDYWLELRGTPIAWSAYPRGDLYLDPTDFVLLHGELDYEPGDDGECLVPADFPPYETPPGGPRVRDPDEVAAAVEPWACDVGGAAGWLVLLPLILRGRGASAARGTCRRGRRRRGAG